MRILALLTTLILSPQSLATELTTISASTPIRSCFGAFQAGSLDQKILLSTPNNPKVDILYTHGFADRRDSHVELFTTLAQKASARVISPELPFHGDSFAEGWQSYLPFKDLDRFDDLAALSRRAEIITRPEMDPQRPLIRMGWSTGGLLGMYEVTNGRTFGSRLHGGVFFAPGLYVRPLVGKYGVVTKETLLDHPEEYPDLEIYPPSPLLRPYFATNLLMTSMAVRWRPFPANFPALIILGDAKRDRYVRSKPAKAWLSKQIRDRDAQLWVVETDLKHAVAMDPRVQDLTARFIDALITGGPSYVSNELGVAPGIYSLDSLVPTP